jgi:hypothetical protein
LKGQKCCTGQNLRRMVCSVLPFQVDRARMPMPSTALTDSSWRRLRVQENARSLPPRHGLSSESTELERNSSDQASRTGKMTRTARGSHPTVGPRLSLKERTAVTKALRQAMVTGCPRPSGGSPDSQSPRNANPGAAPEVPGPAFSDGLPRREKLRARSASRVRPPGVTRRLWPSRR